MELAIGILSLATAIASLSTEVLRILNDRKEEKAEAEDEA